MPERLVFACDHAPFPLVAGKPIRAHTLLTGLTSAFETTLITFAHNPARPEQDWSEDELQDLLPGIDVVTVPARIPDYGRGKRKDQLRSLRSFRSWRHGGYDTVAFGDALQRLVAERRPALIHFDHLTAALAGPARGPVNVYASHNVEYRVVKDTAAAVGGARRFFSEVEWRRIRREELGVWRQMDFALAVSRVDADLMRAGGARRVELCPNGTKPVERKALRQRGADEPFRILFVGALNYYPNEHGIAWFIEHVFSRLRAQVPAELDVVGWKPSRPLLARGVSYAGPVASVEPFYERAHATVVPVFFGSGTRLKVLEAMAYGRPVVSTSLGVEGLELREGTHYVRADDPDTFARVLVSLAERSQRDDPDLETMLSAARQVAERHFWPAIVGRLQAMYQAEIERRARS